MKVASVVFVNDDGSPLEKGALVPRHEYVVALGEYYQEAKVRARQAKHFALMEQAAIWEQRTVSYGHVFGRFDHLKPQMIELQNYAGFAVPRKDVERLFTEMGLEVPKPFRTTKGEAQ